MEYMLDNLISTYEELKKYTFIIDRGVKGILVFNFSNDNFFHLVGLQHLNVTMFIPNYIKTKDKQYKYIKKNIRKFNDIIENQIQEKDSLYLRMQTFINIIDLLNGEKTSLYDIRGKNDGSLINGDFGLLKIYEDIYCFLGLKKIDVPTSENLVCTPITWIADRKAYKRVTNKKPLYISYISKISRKM